MNVRCELQTRRFLVNSNLKRLLLIGNKLKIFNLVICSHNNRHQLPQMRDVKKGWIFDVFNHIRNRIRNVADLQLVFVFDQSLDPIDNSSEYVFFHTHPFFSLFEGYG